MESAVDSKADTTLHERLKKAVLTANLETNLLEQKLQPVFIPAPADTNGHAPETPSVVPHSQIVSDMILAIQMLEEVSARIRNMKQRIDL